ncbi:hypothetical protein BV20DRAFT_966866 [Pilatotrama ljubarskyi]|nr:hypothetical protein BV20DRAFT_966866 [Pilatotrama ljubarskyi]
MKHAAVHLTQICTPVCPAPPPLLRRLPSSSIRSVLRSALSSDILPSPPTRAPLTRVVSRLSRLQPLPHHDPTRDRNELAILSPAAPAPLRPPSPSCTSASHRPFTSSRPHRRRSCASSSPSSRPARPLPQNVRQIPSLGALAAVRSLPEAFSISPTGVRHFSSSSSPSISHALLDTPTLTSAHRLCSHPKPREVSAHTSSPSPVQQGRFVPVADPSCLCM